MGVLKRKKSSPLFGFRDQDLLEQAAESDDLGDTLDYSTLCHRLQTAAAEDHCNLIERRLNDLLEIVFWDPRVQEVTGRLYKPGAVPGGKFLLRELKALDMNSLSKCFSGDTFFGELGCGDLTNFVRISNKRVMGNSMKFGRIR